MRQICCYIFGTTRCILMSVCINMVMDNNPFEMYLFHIIFIIRRYIYEYLSIYWLYIGILIFKTTSKGHIYIGYKESENMKLTKKSFTKLSN